VVFACFNPDPGHRHSWHPQVDIGQKCFLTMAGQQINQPQRWRVLTAMPTARLAGFSS